MAIELLHLIYHSRATAEKNPTDLIKITEIASVWKMLYGVFERAEKKSNKADVIFSENYYLKNSSFN